MKSIEVDTHVTILGDDEVTAVEVSVILSDYKDNREFVLTETGTAKLHAPDTPDDKIGVELALGRALKKLSRRLIRDGYNEVHARDDYREMQQRATERGLELKDEARRAFQQEFAALIEAEHPGTFPQEQPQRTPKFGLSA